MYRLTFLRERVLVTIEMGQQRTWDHIPKRNCMWDTRQRQEMMCNSFIFIFPVETHYTCQVTNQSSHGELSFHHNPHLRLRRSLCLSTFRVIRRGGTRLKNAALLTYCHCCELCAIKQKPGVLLEHKFSKQNFHTKSQLQTVLITASGPQALNALAHRVRYTQGSRQNRCVSSQEALALRANATGKGKISVCFPSAVLQLLYCGSLTLHSVGDCLVCRRLPS